MLRTTIVACKGILKIDEIIDEMFYMHKDGL